MSENWAAEIVSALRAGPCVRVLVVGVRGSAPREIGAEMLVTPAETLGTIGGGQLEYLATQEAVRNLADADTKGHQTHIEQIPLGVARGQCCGGVVRLLFQTLVQADAAFFARLADQQVATRLLTSLNPRLPVIAWLSDDQTEYRTLGPAKHAIDAAAHGLATLREESLAMGAVIRPLELADSRSTDVIVQDMTATGPPVVIFGAGHVGRACAEALVRLNCTVRLVDNRPEMLQPALSAGIGKQQTGDPATEVVKLAANSYVLIMTHDHALDLALCEQVLQRNDLSHVGLIGSATKRRRFEKKLRAAGFGERELKRLNCPVGMASIRSKAPSAIAISVAAEYLQLRETRIDCSATWQAVALAGGDRT